MATYELIEGFEQMDLLAVHAYLVRSYWAGEIPLELVRKAAQNSLCFGVRWNNHQVAFARVVTDKATFAYLSDVYVLEEHRGCGLSRMMMDHIMQHPDLSSIRRFMLVTKDAHGLYSHYGFDLSSTPDRIMEIAKPDLYRTAEFKVLFGDP